MNVQTLINLSRRFARLAALGICVAALAPTVEASNLGVMVRAGMNDAPVQGARVCVGTAANTSQFGSGTTADTGIANIMNIPNGETSLVVTVNKSGFKGAQQAVTLHGTGDTYNQTARVYLELGSGGPVCAATLAPPPEIPVKINSFQINGGQAATTDRSVRLDVSYYGDATHYQVSESADFALAPWREMPAAGTQLTYNFDGINVARPNEITAEVGRTGAIAGGTPVKLTGKRPGEEKYGNKTLYFRLKSGDFVTGKRSDSIELKPITKTYEVTGDDLRELLSTAMIWYRFTFSAKLHSANSHPCDDASTKIDFNYPGLMTSMSNETSKTVEYIFFGGKNLNPYWELKKLEFESMQEWKKQWTLKSSDMRIIPFESSASPRRVVYLTLEGPNAPSTGSVSSAVSGVIPPISPTHSSLLCFPGVIRLVKIKLEGPEGKTWKDAFEH